MNIVFDSIIVIVCITGLWFGAVWIVDSASKIAKRLGLSDLVIGLTIVAIATSSPEFAVSVSAAIKGHTQISVANVIGSNIFNLGIILGIILLFTNLKTNKVLLYRDGFFLLFAGLILILFFINLELSRLEGIILFSFLIIYVVFLFLYKKEVELPEIQIGKTSWYDVPLLILGVATVVASGHFFTESASNVAKELGVSEWLIGITIVGAGTSAPEFATAFVAAVKKKVDMSAGALIGSDIFNVLGVLGISAIFNPLVISNEDYFSLLIMLFSYVILIIMIRHKWQLSRNEGIILILLALFRWLFVFTI
ncbi:MAG: sodium:calcium antiporter [Ignavibacteriales bacterium]|nr:sodium:calcium antiporter [Ignavibacteriales bacterium]